MEVSINMNDYLPHREPMLMVDKIIEMNSEYVETIFKIREDNIFVQNGFFVEAGLIENAAQTCSSIVAKGFYVDENNCDKEEVKVVGFISALKSLKIHALALVGDTIKNRAALVSTFVTDDYTLCTMKCETFLGERLILEGEINLFIQETK